MSEKKTMETIIAKALADADSERIRELMAESLTQQLERYDSKNIIEKALAPFVQSVVKELMEDQQIKDAIASRVRQQVLQACGNMNVRFGY